MKGCINRYNVERGFGWLKIEGQLQLEFFHVSHWNGGNNVPVVGQMVEFEIGADRNGRKLAVNVTPVSLGAVAPETSNAGVK